MDFLTAMIRALEAYRHKDHWRKLQQRGMWQNFSWEKSAYEYIKIYNRVLGTQYDGQPAEQSPTSSVTV
jgi:starch synthase